MSEPHQATKTNTSAQTRWTSREATIVTPHHRTDLDIHELEDEAVLFDPATGDTHKLNATALHLWRQCDGCSTTRQIAEQLATRYQVDFEAALDDVEQSLLGFAERRLLEGTVRVDSAHTPKRAPSS